MLVLPSHLLSPSSWRAWIEMLGEGWHVGSFQVALLVEGVDRNTAPAVAFSWRQVALLVEGVDRNSPGLLARVQNF